MKDPNTKAVGWGVLVAALLAAALSIGCALTVQQERDLGVQFSQQVERQMRTVHDPVVVGYVRDIGVRLVAASGPQPFPFTFGVVDDPSVNAFAGPGGYVYVHTGLLMKARNTSEVAAVMAHEISHVTLRHVSQAVARQEQAAILGAGVAMVSDSPTLGRVAGTGLSIYDLRYDRQAEADADRNGVFLMQRAGYDPNGMITMFRRLESEGGGQGGGFLSSHPSTGDRIERLESYVRTMPRGGLIRDDGRLAAIQARIRSDTGRYSRSTGGPAGGAGPYDGRYDRGGGYGSSGGGQGGGGYGGGTGMDPNGYPNGGYSDPYGR